MKILPLVAAVYMLLSIKSSGQQLEVDYTYQWSATKEYKEKLISALADGQYGEKGAEMIVEKTIAFQSKPIKFKLEFCNSRTLFGPVSKVSEERILAEGEGATSSITASNTEANQKYFRDHSNNQYIHEIFLPVRNYLVKEELIAPEWKISTETRKMQNFICRKATYTKTYPIKSEVTAWYTEDIPIGEGPNGYWGLPGLILLVEVGRSRYEATQISYQADCDAIVPPTKGKEISREELNQMWARNHGLPYPIK